MGEPMRLRLLMALRTRELTVTELAAHQETSPANASKHLHVLVAAGLLQRRRKGLHVLYGIADPAVFPLCDSVCQSLRRALKERARPFGR